MRSTKKVNELKKEVNKKETTKVKQLIKLVQIGQEHIKFVSSSTKFSNVNHLALA